MRGVKNGRKKETQRNKPEACVAWLLVPIERKAQVRLAGLSSADTGQAPIASKISAPVFR
jgi:hypothetical protein